MCACKPVSCCAPVFVQSLSTSSHVTSQPWTKQTLCLVSVTVLATPSSPVLCSVYSSSSVFSEVGAELWLGARLVRQFGPGQTQLRLQERRRPGERTQLFAPANNL